MATIIDGSSGVNRGSFAYTTKIQQLIEKSTVIASAATGTLNFDVLNSAINVYTVNASANWTVNFRGDGSTSLASMMSVGDSLTVTLMVPQGATAYYPSAHTIDGVTVTPKWLSATVTQGDVSTTNVYSYTIIKTGAAAYTLLASKAKYV